MAKVFSTTTQIESYFEFACEEAIQNTAKRMVEELKSYILADFYNLYRPKFYKRTYQLLHSAKYEMLNSSSAEIFIDVDSIHYLIGDPKYETTEEEIVYLASLGYHGTIDIFRPGMFWEDFIKWCDGNVIHIFESELKKQGITR